MDFTQKDRDLIIRHDVKLTQVCETLHKIDDKMDKLNDYVRDSTNAYITKRLFMWINGIIIFLIISLCTYMAVIDKKVKENEFRIEQMLDTHSNLGEYYVTYC